MGDVLLDYQCPESNLATAEDIFALYKNRKLLVFGCNEIFFIITQ